jgi:hypothetical protein
MTRTYAMTMALTVRINITAGVGNLGAHGSTGPES